MASEDRVRRPELSVAVSEVVRDACLTLAAGSWHSLEATYSLQEPILGAPSKLGPDESARLRVDSSRKVAKLCQQHRGSRRGAACSRVSGLGAGADGQPACGQGGGAQVLAASWYLRPIGTYGVQNRSRSRCPIAWIPQALAFDDALDACRVPGGRDASPRVFVVVICVWGLA